MINWEQLKTILWLRVRLTRNLWSRTGSLGPVLTLLLVIAGVTTSVFLFGGGIAAGVFLLADTKPLNILLTWDVLIMFFLVAWMIGLLTELQRAESIDLQKLMHLPVALGQLFVVNYLASHFTLSLILCVPAMLGLAIGLAIGRTPAMLLLAPLALTMVFMITAWTYCLRGWLAALMSNPRRRRSAMLIISMVVVLISQLPNIYFNLMSGAWNKQPPARSTEEARQRQVERRAREQKMFKTFTTAQKFLPPFWTALCAKNIAEQRAWPAFPAIAGCAVIGAAGLYRAYRGTLRMYRGDLGNKAQPQPAQPSLRAAAANSRSLLVEKRLPGCSAGTSAVALATFLSMTRAPEVRMQWAMGVMMTVVFGAMMILRVGQIIPGEGKPVLVTGVFLMPLMMFVQVMGNHFGFDRAGFRAFVLSPIDRRDILLGKNLASIPVIAGLALALTLGTTIYLRAGVSAFVTALFAAATMLLLASILGNALSILSPYRIRQGTLKPTKMPAKAQLTMVLAHLCFPPLMVPALLPCLAAFLWVHFNMPPFPIGPVLGLLMLAAAAAAYWFSLSPLARLLDRRQLKVLEAIATDVE